MFRGSARGSHRTKLWGMLLEAQISAKMGKMKSGIGRGRLHSKKLKRVEAEDGVSNGIIQRIVWIHFYTVFDTLYKNGDIINL